MFFDLVRKNSRRSRKENGLFFASLLIVIVAFYMILSLSRLDVMIFLKKMESDAVNKLLLMIPVFYGITLFILFFLVYFASRYQLERRQHEFGVCLMLGMRRSRLFWMLLAEDLWSSLLSLAAGIPAAVLIAELVSLITARLVGLGILGHQTAFSGEAVLGTAAGFLLIKLAAFILLSGRISRMEIRKLLTPEPRGTKKRIPAGISAAELFTGVVLLGAAYGMAIQGFSWGGVGRMAMTMVSGLAGTFLVFFGLRAALGFLARHYGKKSGLHVFCFRQLEEYVIHQPASLAVSSLLILAALCCFGFGVATSWSYGSRETHTLDYTFSAWYGEDVEEILERSGVRNCFGTLFQMKTGYIRVGNGSEKLERKGVMELLEQEEISEERDALKSILQYADYPHIISLSGYNELLHIAGEEEVSLLPGEAAVYMDSEFISAGGKAIMERILNQKPEVDAAGKKLHLTGEVQTRNLVVDSSITLSFALIVEDEVFEYLTAGDYEIYWDAILAPELLEGQGLMQAITQVNERLEDTGLEYESYLQNIGRQLFYVVAASYLTLYLAVIFLIIANTMLGVQFLMQQKKTGQRYRTLLRLGSTCEDLCEASGRQIRWYFGIPILVAVISSLFGIQALCRGMLPPEVQSETSGILVLAAAMLFFLCVVEWCYLRAVIRAGERHILALAEPEREE